MTRAAHNQILAENAITAMEVQSERDARPYVVKRNEFLKDWRKRFEGLTIAQAERQKQWWHDHHSTRKAYFVARKMALVEIQN